MNILPCPRCGATNTLNIVPAPHVTDLYVMDIKCECGRYAYMVGKKEEASSVVEKWNRSEAERAFQKDLIELLDKHNVRILWDYYGYGPEFYIGDVKAELIIPERLFMEDLE